MLVEFGDGLCAIASSIRSKPSALKALLLNGRQVEAHAVEVFFELFNQIAAAVVVNKVP